MYVEIITRIRLIAQLLSMRAKATISSGGIKKELLVLKDQQKAGQGHQIQFPWACSEDQD